ncbi:MAG: D-alanyl-D-alanine carboxypeptidase [Opitutae bacterium]|nr:D-alanyl-D-alanine carboxypeptidase [Opitutae bacterium]
MFSLRQLALVTVLLAAAASLSAARKSAPHKPAAPTGAAYLGAIVTDAETGHVLFEDNADVVSPPASMTKLMTFAVLHDQLASGALKLDTPVTVTAADSKIGGTQVWLKEKEVFPVEELLYAMMIQSANDAAYALARTAAGSAEAFVELMNAKARALGLAHTEFRTPHGLPPANRHRADGDLTTPRDFAVLCRYLLRETDVTKYTSIRTRPFGAGVRAAPVEMRNHNHLLGKVAGLDGLKTGFTNGAGFCLAATVERHGRRLIVVTMGSAASKTRDFKVAELIERGFAALPAMPTITTAGPGVAPASVQNAARRALAPVAPDLIPTVKTDKSAAAPAAADPASTAKEPVVTFRVILPEKKS